MTRSTTSHTAAMAGAARAGLAPHGADGARRRRLGETPDGQAALRSERRFHREFGQQGDAEAGDHHLAQGFETGRAKILGLADIDPAADFQGLIAQTVAVLQQQQGMAFQILAP